MVYVQMLCHIIVDFGVLRVLEPAPCACPGPTAVIWWEQEVRVTLWKLLVTLWHLV